MYKSCSAITLHTHRIVEVFFEKDADCVVLPGYNDETPLHKAVFDGHIETVKLILGYKPNVNAR